MAELPDTVRHALEGTNFWHLATLNPDGSPQVTPVWVGVRDGKVFVNSHTGRKKQRNLDHDPRVALSAYDPDSPYSNMAIQGRVVDRIEGLQAEADINELAHKYMGKDYPLQEGEQRVTYVIEPTHVWQRA
jgi:PPOX class probable F420-dependent enzyme